MFLHQMRQLGFDDTILAPSSSESTRLHRAFLRYDIYCSVFAPNEFGPLENPYQFSGVEQFDLFLRRLRPWEVEEMACVQVYFALLTGDCISQLEEQLIDAVQSTPGIVWPSSPDSKPGEGTDENGEKQILSKGDDMREFKNLDITNLMLFSKDGIYSSPDSITHMTSLGLEFMYLLCKSEDRRSDLIRSNPPDYREFLPEALSHSPACTPEDQNQVISIEKTDSLDDPSRENLGYVLFGNSHNMRTVY
ncbi:hypothetical protein J7337_001930 [Fusarium musae]|uniref:Uncharacterized protein n=1 Tax=Fusarium musae TaxID=1042133 RepID=A0A9P8DVH6_9HYPO|nr:hypothetical protein J7337_001930 [Fusarium musae]KAG9508366.1 hypothetical protein J7337_001930 [Fusarium musae]